MDYATHAFVRFAGLGCPTREEYENRIRSECYKRYSLLEPSLIVLKAENAVSIRKPLLEDIAAVNRVLSILQATGKTYISDAIKEVYLVSRDGKKPERGVIMERVTHFSMTCPASTKAVFSWLKSARALFAKERGLDIGYGDEKW